ncbi:hypothetical protein Daus18300_011551 [Diaporthe australafricana]|uniref:Uncharacterized protein n=1 Tax=Diaporthe australafricana TaxID=127596 RepID=A0ABR3W661_9PEZI
MPSINIPYDTSSSPRQRQPLNLKLSTNSTHNASSPILPPSPPPSPCPWLWRCHSCYTIYRLAVTRRCLECDHTLCLGEPSDAPSKGRKRRRSGSCKAEFDYAGWKVRGAWRRTVLLNGESDSSSSSSSSNNDSEENWGNEHGAATRAQGETESHFEDKRDALFLRRRHDCWVHCDFPSECHHALFRAQQEGRPILRDAEALDAAAREAAEKERKKNEMEKTRRARKLTVQEYKKRHFAERKKSTTSMKWSDRELSTVDEESAAAEASDDGISPCSPTSSSPPRELMRDVSPVDDEPVSPTTRRPSWTKRLPVTDTPADFATTAAPLDFDGCSDEDDDDELEPHHQRAEHRRAMSCRKVAQLTGEGLESFGPFNLNTRAPSPSPSSQAAAANTNSGARRMAVQLTAHDLQAAYSEQAWFDSASASPESLSPKSPERVCTRDRMLALLGRRSSGSPISPQRLSPVFPNASASARILGRENQRAAAAAAAVEAEGEDWESWSDSSSSSASSTSSAVSLLSSSSNEGEEETRGVAGPAPAIIDITDADGDISMHEADVPRPVKEVDENMDSPVTPLGEHGAGARDEELDLMALLRMRNAFMRGEMS